jgi:hypothetical protein
MAGYTIPNAPSNISLQAYRGAANRLGEFAKTCKFAVMIIPSGNLLKTFGPIMSDLVFLTEATELPGRGLIHASFRHYGPEYHLPVQSQYVDQTIQFYCRSESFERQFFDDWMDLINPPSTFNFMYKDDYKAYIRIFQFADWSDNDDEVPTVKYSWTLHDAWPMNVMPQPVNWADPGLLKLSVAFSYHHWTRENRTPNPFQHQLVSGKNVITSGAQGGKTIV